jgi:hypothetical protein
MSDDDWKRQRESLVKEARSWLRWANNPPSVVESGTDHVRQFAETVLRILDVEVSPISVDKVIAAVVQFNREAAAGIGSLKLPHEVLQEEGGLPTSDCKFACEQAAKAGLIMPGKVAREQWYLSERGLKRWNEGAGRRGNG